MTTPQEKDRYIVEWFGEFIHEIKTRMDGMLVCSCGKSSQGMGYYDEMESHLNQQKAVIDLTSDSGFIWLWERMRKDNNIWGKFSETLFHGWEFSFSRIEKLTFLIDNRVLFRDTVFGFLQTQKGE